MTTDTNRIERSIVLQAPIERVWHALSDAASFGAWFGVNFPAEAAFTAGKRVRGNVSYPGYEYLMFDVEVERVEPPRLLSWRWHPAPTERGRDYSDETPTLVVLELSEQDGGTLLKVTESGFDQVPAERRAEAFSMNSEGWTGQMQNIADYLAKR